MTDGTFLLTGGGIGTLDATRSVDASISTSINDIVLGSGPLGPQPFLLTGDGNLTATGVPVNAVSTTGGGDLTLDAAKAARVALGAIAGGDTAMAAAGAKIFGPYPLLCVELLIETPALTFGTAPEPPPAPLVLTLLDTSVAMSPGSLTIFAGNGTPEGEADIAITGVGSVTTATFDDTGALAGVSVPIDVPTDGTYELVVTDATTTLTVASNFDVESIVAPTTIGVPVTTPPVNVQPGLGVKKWVFQDPATSEVYHFAINPSTMNTPFGPKHIVFQGTTAVNGQKIAFEGMAGPVEWQFEGVLFTQQQYADFVHWASKSNRIWITDHFSRAWLCYITQFAPVPRRDTGHYWTHNWTINALIFEGPVTPT